VKISWLLHTAAFVTNRLRAEGIDEHVKQVNRFTSVVDAVEDFQKNPDQITNN
jgi:hypothetical protein